METHCAHSLMTYGREPYDHDVAFRGREGEVVGPVVETRVEYARESADEDGRPSRRCNKSTTTRS